MIGAEGLWDVGMVDGCPSSNEANCEVEYGWVEGGGPRLVYVWGVVGATARIGCPETSSGSRGRPVKACDKALGE